MRYLTLKGLSGTWFPTLCLTVCKICSRSIFWAFAMLWAQCVVAIVVQSLNHVQPFAIPRTAAHQASLSFPVSQSLLKLIIPTELVMPSNHLILCLLLLLLPSIFPSTRVFSKESALRIRWPKYWRFSFSYQHHWSNEREQTNEEARNYRSQVPEQFES